MNQRPFHAVRWFLSQLVFIAALIGCVFSIAYTGFLIMVWLTQVMQ